MKTNQQRNMFLTLWLCLLGFSMSTYAQEAVELNYPAASFDSQLSADNNMSVIEKENRRCIRCHQKKRLLKGIEAITSVGMHASTKYYDNCSACHGNKGRHPKDDALPNVTPFNNHANVPVFEQNERCITCHSPGTLRQSEWTHDVHATKLVCSTCHSLHQDADPIIGISKAFRIGLCATCHEAIQRDKHATGQQ
ncbi:multiheme c-type cytochrome [Vibrio hangzhouensis]|uniref:multiheme c-type cytochrome n=1 Tax=Vibrio hangzhouensis TaxID=462991 RepID=UPI001C944524|nr:multiheme c-type cytochrome [Vibrio hangzhouensis]MBY6197249.1 cytochrome C [Vibrio hangzhouensis]